MSIFKDKIYSNVSIDGLYIRKQILINQGGWGNSHFSSYVKFKQPKNIPNSVP